MLFQDLIAPLGLAMLFSALISLAYMYFHSHEPDVQKNSLILFAVLFLFTGICLLLPR